MPVSRVAWLVVSGVICIAAVPQSVQLPPGSPPQAAFKTGVDIVQLDVSVFDKDRRPIKGLTAADFTILENGTPQLIVAVLPVDVPGPIIAGAGWQREMPLDVVANAGETRRLVAIVMDDANTGVDHGESRSARQIASGIVEQMGPDDRAAVVFTYLGRPQNWTADRSRLRASIDSFIPRATSRPGLPGVPAPSSPGAPARTGGVLGGAAGSPLGCQLKRGGCLVDTLRNIGAVLQNAPAGRKMVMLISSNGALNVMADNDQIGPVQDMFRSLQRANVTVYAFDPRGLTTDPSRQEADDLWSIAAATGGSLIANTNTPEVHVPQVFRENASYYLVGFRPTDTTHNRFRRIQVRMNRPDAQAHTRLGYYLPGVDRKGDRNNRVPSTPLESALTAAVPSAEQPISLAVAPFAVPGKREAVLTLVAGLQLVGGATGAVRRHVIVASVFDRDGREVGTHRQTLELKPRADRVGFEVFSRIPVKPGTYEVRFAHESEGRAGSVFTSVDVPEFWKADLSLSGVLVSRTPSLLVANPNEIAGITDIRPTTVRAFARDERLHAFVRVYRKPGQPTGPVRLSTRIVNDRDEAVFERSDSLSDGSFSSGATDYGVDVPLAQLSAGEYLLTFEATGGDARVTRTVRFSVR